MPIHAKLNEIGLLCFVASLLFLVLWSLLCIFDSILLLYHKCAGFMKFTCSCDGRLQSSQLGECSQMKAAALYAASDPFNSTGSDSAPVLTTLDPPGPDDGSLALWVRQPGHLACGRLPHPRRRQPWSQRLTMGEGGELLTSRKPVLGPSSPVLASPGAERPDCQPRGLFHILE